MQYQVTKEKSAEYLRQAISHMSLQDAAFHPVSYAVWYEYSSGEHAKLIDEVNVLIEKEKKLNEKSTAYLYHKHIANLDADSAKEIVERFNKVVSDITHTTAKTGQDTSQFKQVLDTWSTEIHKLDQAIGAQMSGLITETTRMQQSINTLQSQLESSLHEVTSLKNEIIKAKQEALSDGLTGLMNRKAFDHVINDCVTTNEAEEACLVIADIDFFKRVNDTYGHLFGDKVIQAVANILKSASGFQFTAARYGGEEFVLLLPNASLKIAQQTAEKIRQLVEKIKIKNSVTNRLVSDITISLGIAQYRRGESVDAFISRADQALYISKARGRNQVTIVSDGLKRPDLKLANNFATA